MESAVFAKQISDTSFKVAIPELKGADLKALKLDPDFIRYIAEKIENAVEKEKKEHPNEKIDKLKLFTAIHKKLYLDIKPEDIELAKGMLEFLLKNKHVKKTPLKKIVMFYLKKKFCMASD